MVIDKGTRIQMCFLCPIDHNCIIILLSVTMFVCHDKGNRFSYFFVCNKFTSICILETNKNNYCIILSYTSTYD